MKKTDRTERNQRIYYKFATLGRSAIEIGIEEGLHRSQVTRIVKEEQARMLKVKCECCGTPTNKLYDYEWDYGILEVCFNCKMTHIRRERN